MNIKVLIILAGICLFSAVSISSPVYAGGGFVTVTIEHQGVINGRGVHVQAKVQPNILGENTIGAKAEFQVRSRADLGQPYNPVVTNHESGAYCTTSDPIVNAQGMVYGECFGTQTGIYMVGLNLYLPSYGGYSAQAGADVVSFYATLPATPAPKASPTVTLPTPTLVPTNIPTPVPPIPAPTFLKKVIPLNIWGWLTHLIPFLINLK